MHAQAIVQQLPILMLISFDGFRYDYLSPSLTPNLYDLSTQATVGHMESMYITKTFPNHFSMVTGLYEDEHEMINNKMFDPRLNQTFKPGDLSTDWWNYKGTNMPIWTANELLSERMGQRRFSASMMYPGSSTPYQDILPTHLRDFAKNANWTDNIETVIDWLTDYERPANFVSMYFDAPDSIAHLHGPWGKETLESVRKIDSVAGYLVKRLRDLDLADRTNIIFVSDHGMAEVKQVVFLNDLMDTSDFELHGASPDWSVFVKPNKRHRKTQIFIELLKVSKKGHFRVYKREDIPPELHYSKTVRIGDFFIITEDKYDLFMERSKTGSKSLANAWGNHGWKPSNRDMRPLFLAYGPSFKRNYNHQQVFPNIDLFPLMTFLLGLPSESLPNNGSLARIIDVIDVGHFESGNGPARLDYMIDKQVITSSAASRLRLDLLACQLIMLALIVSIALLTYRSIWAQVKDGQHLDASYSFVAYVLFIGAIMLTLLGLVFTLFASSSKPAYKPHVDFDDLAPGLNIDLGYYLTSEQLDSSKRRHRRNEELVLLLK